MDNPQIFALRRNRVLRPIKDDELEQVQAFSNQGTGTNKNIGILFIHGFTVTPANFYAYARKINENGYSVYLPLLPGHGRNYSDLDKVTREDWKKTIEGGFELLRTEWNCSKIVIIGMSLGGALAIWLASKNKEIDKLILLAPAVYPLTLLSFAKIFVMPILKILGIKYWKHIAGDVKNEDGFEFGYRKVSIKALGELYQTMKETEKLLPEVNTPCLIFQGRIDHEIPAHKVQEIYDKLGTQSKELVWLENSYHEIPREKDSPMVLARIQEELKKVSIVI